MLKSDAESKLESKLVKIYKDKGLKVFLDCCSEMLNLRDREDFEKKKKFNGAVCEIVLVVLSQHYMRLRGIKGSGYHSVILGDKSKPNSKFRTELDYTMVSPNLCLTAECKSLVGDIVVTDECTLERKDFSADVARQLSLHSETLKPYLKDFTLEGKKLRIGTFCFVYSNASIVDKRTKEARSKIPIITIRNLVSYYDVAFSKFKGGVYDYNKVSKFLLEASSSATLYKEHRDFLGY